MKATKKIFNYDDKESILDILHTPIACGFYHCLGIGIFLIIVDLLNFLFEMYYSFQKLN